ncbi:uncharacterized protein SOCE26_004870 [Sorangium cellulosum]|uniref:Uncharacterized protein n=1 Tax=Sorangium cellulosum TaxID=56 RepID=A0A2L0EIH7_SORCE|nr:hypothetical protein [Sorangium cellulosum]AUX39105.1 uncharacterized protein SOCE26_004870 [Sorangium cellulosum]
MNERKHDQSTRKAAGGGNPAPIKLEIDGGVKDWRSYEFDFKGAGILARCIVINEAPAPSTATKGTWKKDSEHWSTAPTYAPSTYASVVIGFTDGSWENSKGGIEHPSKRGSPLTSPEDWKNWTLQHINSSTQWTCVGEGHIETSPLYLRADKQVCWRITAPSDNQRACVQLWYNDTGNTPLKTIDISGQYYMQCSYKFEGSAWHTTSSMN